MSDASLAVFAYGSLISRDSIAETLGAAADEPIPARLDGWRRRWSLIRDNRTSEKGFVPVGDEEPFDWCLGLNIEPAGPQDWLNGALIEIDDRALDRLREREIRYDAIDVSPAVKPRRFERVVTFAARSENFAADPPADSVVIAAYLAACESGFDTLGPGELDAFRETTGPPPVRVVEAILERDDVPEGNPREW